MKVRTPTLACRHRITSRSRIFRIGYNSIVKKDEFYRKRYAHTSKRSLVVLSEAYEKAQKKLRVQENREGTR